MMCKVVQAAAPNFRCTQSMYVLILGTVHVDNKANQSEALVSHVLFACLFQFNTGGPLAGYRLDGAVDAASCNANTASQQSFVDFRNAPLNFFRNCDLGTMVHLCMQGCLLTIHSRASFKMSGRSDMVSQS